MDKHEAWAAATTEAIPVVHFSLNDLVYYTKALRKCINRSATLLRSQYIDKVKLVERLSARGIADVKGFYLSTCPIYKRIRSFICARNSVVFRQLRFPLTAREKLHILEACYRRLRSPSNGTIPLTSLPNVSMQLLVECTVERMKRVDPVWQPPAQFQRWIRSWSHVSLFSKKNNAEIKNPVEDTHPVRAALSQYPDHAATLAISPLRTSGFRSGADGSARVTEVSYYALDVLGCSYGWLRSSDIFADATEETIPPESVARRDVDISTYHDSSSLNLNISCTYESETSCDPTSPVNSPEPPQRHDFEGNTQDNSLSALKISVPAYTTSFDTLESSDELNIQSNEGWLQFLN